TSPASPSRGTHGSPATSAYPGFTGITRPGNPWRRRPVTKRPLRAPGRGEAPTTATEAGASARRRRSVASTSVLRAVPPLAPVPAPQKPVPGSPSRTEAPAFAARPGGAGVGRVEPVHAGGEPLPAVPDVAQAKAVSHLQVEAPAARRGQHEVDAPFAE